MQTQMFEEFTDRAPQRPTLAKRLPVYGVRLVRERSEEYAAQMLTIRTPGDAANIARQMLEDQSRECLLVLLVDTKNRAIGLHVASVGILDSAMVSPREVFQAAILANAAAILLAHNHPSGDPTPSAEDRRITQRLVECGKLMNIELLDHVVIGHDGAFRSLRELGVF